MKKTRLLLLALTAIAMVGCGEVTSNTTDKGSDSTVATDTTNSDKGNTDSTSGGSSDTGSSDVVKNKYNIVVESDSRYSITFEGGDKKTAEKGETITFTVTPSAGFTLSHVYIDSTELSGTDGKYTFTMPGHDIRITVSLSVDGDVTIQGGITAVLSLGEDGVYRANDVLVSTDANISFCVKGNDGSLTQLDSWLIDRTKTMADVEPAYNSTYKLTLAGGFKYNFSYDPSATLPCTIVRSEVTTLPNSAASLEHLFQGKIKSENTQTLQGLTHVTYTNSKMAISYDWKKYNDNKSLATIKDTSGKNLADKYVYKAIEGDMYTVVDTFDRNNYSVDAWEIAHKEDTYAFSGNYKISDVDTSRGGSTATDLYSLDYESDYMNGILANYDLNKTDFDLESLDFDIDSAYRVQMSVQDEITYVKLNITSVADADGGFTTTIDSARVYDATAVASNASYGITDKYYDTYAVTLKFTKDGKILSGSYLDTRYSEGNYTLSGNTVTTVGDGTKIKELSFTYEYGSEYDMLQAFDTTPYFTTSINPVIRNENAAGTDTGNIVSVGDVLEQGRKLNSDIVELNALPATALDTWQYHVVDTSNASVIRWDDTYRNYTAFGAGTVDLTIGKFVNDNAKKTVSVTSKASYSIRNFYLDNSRRSDVTYSDQMVAYEGESDTFILCANAEAMDTKYNVSGQVIPPSDLTFTLTVHGTDTVDTSGLKVTYNPVGKYNSTITLDATDAHIDADTVLDLTINTSMYAKYTTSSGTEVVDGPTVFTVYFFDQDDAATIDTIQGDWSYTSSDGKTNASLNFTKNATTDTTYSTSYPYTGSITVNGTVYGFYYGFDTHTYAIKVHFTTANVYGSMGYVADDDAIQVCVYSETYNYDDGEYSTDITEIIGSVDSDDEGNVDYYYDDFARAK